MRIQLRTLLTYMYQKRSNSLFSTNYQNFSNLFVQQSRSRHTQATTPDIQTDKQTDRTCYKQAHLVAISLSSVTTLMILVDPFRKAAIISLSSKAEGAQHGASGRDLSS